MTIAINRSLATTEKIKSKFESESEVDEADEVGSRSPSPLPDDDDDDGQYVQHTPPESPVELAPDLPPYYPAIQGCRNVEEFSCLNRIEEGTYGVVYRAKDKKTGTTGRQPVDLLLHKDIVVVLRM